MGKLSRGELSDLPRPTWLRNSRDRTGSQSRGLQSPGPWPLPRMARPQPGRQFLGCSSPAAGFHELLSPTPTSTPAPAANNSPLGPHSALCQVRSLQPLGTGRLEPQAAAHAEPGACTQLGHPQPNPKPQVQATPGRATSPRHRAALGFSVPGRRGQECRLELASPVHILCPPFAASVTSASNLTLYVYQCPRL